MHLSRTLIRSNLALTIGMSLSVSMGIAAHAQPVGSMSPQAATAIALAGVPEGPCYGGYTTDAGASACFVPHGEHLWYCDNKADGHHPGVEWAVNHASTFEHRDSRIGDGNCQVIDLSIAESGTITFYALNYEDEAQVSVSNRFTVSADG